MTGLVLEERGRHDWAAREWDASSAPRRLNRTMGIVAARSLAELYHDLERDDRAAATLAIAEKIISARSNHWKLLGDEDPLPVGELQARRHFFEACHWRDQGDRAKQRTALDEALATQAYDIEVLIECYRLPDAPAEYRATHPSADREEAPCLARADRRRQRQPRRGPAVQRVRLAGGQYRGRSRRARCATPNARSIWRRTTGRIRDTLARVYSPRAISTRP